MKLGKGPAGTLPSPHGSAGAVPWKFPAQPAAAAGGNTGPAFVIRSPWSSPRPPREGGTHAAGTPAVRRGFGVADEPAGVGAQPSPVPMNLALPPLHAWWQPLCHAWIGSAVIRDVIFDVGECLVDETREYSTWAGWLGVPRYSFAAVFGRSSLRAATTGDVPGVPARIRPVRRTREARPRRPPRDLRRGRSLPRRPRRACRPPRRWPVARHRRKPDRQGRQDPPRALHPGRRPHRHQRRLRCLEAGPVLLPARRRGRPRRAE